MFLAGCSTTPKVTYYTDPPGGYIRYFLPDGINYGQAPTPFFIDYVGINEQFKAGGCQDITTPTAIWPDGSKSDPIKLNLCRDRGLQFSWTFLKPSVTLPKPNTTYQPPSAPVDLSDAKKKCTDIGIKPGTEQFGKCVLQLSKP
jgi:hypothetical protein